MDCSDGAVNTVRRAASLTALPNEHINWAKRKVEGPLDKQQAKRLSECLAVVEETLRIMKEVPERYYIHEWVLTHQFIVNEAHQRGLGKSKEEGGIEILQQHNGHTNGAQKPIVPTKTPPTLLEEIFLIEAKIAELLKVVLAATPTNPYVKLTSIRRKANLQRLNLNLYAKFAQLWGIIEGSHHKLIRDEEGSGFWFSSFKGRFMVSWTEFMAAWESRFEALRWTTKNTEDLRRILDYSHSGSLSALQFSEFLKGFGPFSSSATNFLDITAQPWFHAYMSFEDAERLLNNEPAGTFLFRLRNTRPGSFALAAVMPGNAVIQLVINSNHPMGFKVKDDDNCFLTCATLGDIVEMYKNILKKPFTSTINEESWFHGDLTGVETQTLLAGQNRGKFLVRFSKDHPDCFATAYVDNNGEVTHALIKKTPQGYQHGEDKLFPTINQLITAYQGVLSFPWTDDDDIIKDISREAQELISYLQEGTNENATPDGDLSTEKEDEAELSVPVSTPRRMTKVEKLVGASIQDRVFGTDLVKYMQQHLKYPIPLVAEQSILYLNAHAKTLGLFGKAPVNAEEIRLLKESFDKGHDVDLWHISNPHVVAALLKVYLRELPNPLLCNSLYKDFVAITEMQEDKKLEHLAVVLKRLPPEHAQLLRYLMKLFLKMQQEVGTNFMDAENLGIEMGPYLLRSNNATMASSVSDTQKASEITTLLITNARTLLPDLDTLTLDWVVYDDIVLTPNRRKIKSATKERLVQTLFSSSCLSPGSVPTYVPKFLLTYRAFMTPTELMDMIQDTFFELQNDPASPKRGEKMLRICSFLKKWTEEQSYAFRQDEQLFIKYKNFVGGILDAKLLKYMMSSLSRLEGFIKGQKRKKERVFRTPPPRPLLPKVKGTITKLSDIKTQELARQITLMEYKMFSKIQPQELCESAWTKKDKETAAPNILRIAHRFNDMVWWMVTQIVSCDKQSKREDLVQKFIDLAVYCNELNNFNCLMAVVVAFGTASLARLDDVKKKLEMSPVFQELKEMMSHDNNSRNYRARISQCNPPLVPHLGFFQTDLVFIEDGNKLWVQDQIHFYKCYMVAEIIQQIQQYQQTPYNLTPVKPIKDFLRNIKPLSEDDCWNLSLVIKPQRKPGTK